MSTKNSRVGIRASFFFIALFFLTSLITYRLFNLTFERHSEFVRSAKNQYNNPSTFIAGRGNIFFSDLVSGVKKIVATNRTSFFLYSNNTAISSAQKVAGRIAPILNEDPAALKLLLSQEDKTYLVLARNLSGKQVEDINSLKEKGLTVASEVTRYYDGDFSAAHILGFVGFDQNQRLGRYGVESSYDSFLSGENKTQEMLGNQTYSAILNFLKFWVKDENNKEDDGKSTLEEKQIQYNLNISGSDVVLTIDRNIQSAVELALNSVLKKWDAVGGSIIVEDPNSGAILAMASSPSFDPNNYSKYSLNDFLNPNVQEIFEPGSSFKPFTMAAALDSGVITPDTIYNDTGEIKIGSYVIRNFNEKANGIQTMRQVLEHSLNTGAIFAQEKTGNDQFLNYVINFGFGQKTGIDLNGEVTGNVSNLYSGRKINFATASFGQGVAVTPLQLVNAYSAIANGGKLMRPYVVKEIIRPDGTIVTNQPKILGTPITEKTSVQLKSMLVDVVDKGFDKARVNGYDIAGKTGTAQIPDPNSRGYLGSDQFIHDFVGFAPAYEPKFVVLIKMERPKGIKFAADSLSPVFGDIARFLIRYFNIPPTR